MKKILYVENMSCEHCKATIENALKDLKGINNFEVDLQKKTITIDFSDAVIDLNEIILTIKKGGYNASIK